MSEKIDPEIERNATSIADDDPLAELARIVAGEPEPEPVVALQEPQAVERDIPEPVQEAFVQEDEEADLGRALEDALGAELGISEEPQYQLEIAADLPDEAQQISEALDAIDDAPPVAQVAASAAPAAFEDDLINALRGELTAPGQPEFEPVPAVNEEVHEPDAEQVEVSDAVEDVDFSGFEEALSAELEAGQTEPSRQQETAVEFTPEEAAEPVVEDFADAFNQEFEEILAAEVRTAPAQQADEFAVPQDFDAVEENHFVDQTSSAAVVAGTVVTEAEPVQAQSVDELDFGSAFAEELGVDKVDEFNGWTEQDTSTAEDEFSGAMAAHYDNGDFDTDPGHLENVGALHADDEYYDQGEEKPAGGSRKYAVAALVLAIFAGTIIAGYGFLGGSDGTTGGGEPQLIKADTDPVKVKPDDPGGKVVANQDKASYERVAGEDTDPVAQEELISNTEEPAKIEAPASTPETILAEKTDDRLDASQDEGAEASPSGNGSVTPRVVQTVSVKPDGTIVQSAPTIPGVSDNVSQAASEAVETVRESQIRLSEAITAPRPVETEVIKKPEPIEGAVSSGSTAVPEASPLPKPEPVQQAAPAPQPEPQPVQTAAVSPEPTPAPAPVAVQRSEWVVQVSSQRSAEAAQASYQNLSNRFSVIRGRPMSIQRANVNGDTFYRVRLQTSSRADANQLCESLKASGGSCFVSR